MNLSNIDTPTDIVCAKMRFAAAAFFDKLKKLRRVER